MPTGNVFVQVVPNSELVMHSLAKYHQDVAYMTYRHNIQWSKDLDAILSSAPGYLRKSHGI